MCGGRSPLQFDKGFEIRKNLIVAKVIGHIYYTSSIPPCYKCGKGNVCKVGGLWGMLDRDEEKLKNFRLTQDMFRGWEDCPETVMDVEKYAKMLSEL